MKSNKTTFFIYFIAFYPLLFISCSNVQANAPITFDNKIMNQQILLQAPEFFNTYRTGDAISIEIKNTTSYEVSFPNNYNIKLFLWVGDEWTEIQEIPTVRLPEGDDLLGRLGTTPIFVSPAYPDYNQSYQLRVYIFGDMKVENNTVKVGAYTDVLLEP